MPRHGYPSEEHAPKVDGDGDEGDSESDDDDLLDVVDEDDFRTMEDMIEPPIDVQSIRVGSRFRAPKDVQDMLAVFARK